MATTSVDDLKGRVQAAVMAGATAAYNRAMENSDPVEAANIAKEFGLGQPAISAAGVRLFGWALAQDDYARAEKYAITYGLTQKEKHDEAIRCFGTILRYENNYLGAARTKRLVDRYGITQGEQRDAALASFKEALHFPAMGTALMIKKRFRLKKSETHGLALKAFEEKLKDRDISDATECYIEAKGIADAFAFTVKEGLGRVKEEYNSLIASDTPNKYYKAAHLAKAFGLQDMAVEAATTDFDALMTEKNYAAAVHVAKELGLDMEKQDAAAAVAYADYLDRHMYSNAARVAEDHDLGAEMVTCARKLSDLKRKGLLREGQ